MNIEEAILELNRYIYGKNLSKDEIVDYLGIIFAGIEKQSKVIEELTENKGYHLGFIDGGIAERYKMEDKIKAKIEELDDLNSPFAQRVIKGKEVYLTEMVQNILRELLEKE